MNIAMFTNNYKPFVGGVPISIERLSNGLRQLGHKVYIFAPEYENQEEEKDIIRYKSFKRSNDCKFVIPNSLDPIIKEKFEEFKIDIIHVHHPMLVGWNALYLKYIFNKPVVFTYHTRYEQYLHNVKMFEMLEGMSKSSKNRIIKDMSQSVIEVFKNKVVPMSVKMFANSCDKVFAPTQLIEEYLLESGVSTDITTLPTGIDENSFIKNDIKAAQIRKKYSEDKKHVFCTVSRLSKEKNIEFIIDGLKLLKDKVGNSFKLLIIGDGPLKDELVKKTIDLGLEENIEFVGAVPNYELQYYYDASDLFLFASKSETQGIVLIEAMAAGKPVVAIEASGVIDIVCNDINGYMTEENMEKWTQKVEYLINNANELERLSEEAYKTARKYSSIEIAKIAATNYENVIHELLIQKGDLILNANISSR